MLDDVLSFTGHAKDLHQAGSHLRRKEFKLIFPGTPLATRQALKSVGSGLKDMNVGMDSTGVVEIVLAEVLNNVVEHAYLENGGGVISLCCALDEDVLHFEIIDEGRPLPKSELPDGHPPAIDLPRKDLPEGGFGWFLIKELTRDVSYSRRSDRNRLRFDVPLVSLESFSG